MHNVSKISTKRLQIKTLKLKHITKKYIDGLNDPLVNKFLVDVRLKRQTFKSVKDFIEKNLNSPDSMLCGIFIKDNNELIGTIRIHNISHFHYSCSLGICIFNRNYWFKGYGLEALQEVVRYIFEKLELHYIEAGTYKENAASVRLFTKNDFKLRASFVDKYRHIDSFKEVLIFAKTNTKFDNSLLQRKHKLK